MTQEPHLCENCGHVDPLELPYCGFCGHPNGVVLETSGTDTLAGPPTAGTAAAAAELAELIVAPSPGPAGHGGALPPEPAAPPTVGLTEAPDPDGAPVTTDFDFNADPYFESLSDAAGPGGAEVPLGGVPLGGVPLGDLAVGEVPPGDLPVVVVTSGPAATAEPVAPAVAPVSPVEAALAAAPPPVAPPLVTPGPPPGAVPPFAPAKRGPGGGAPNRSRTPIIVLALVVVVGLVVGGVLVASGGSTKKPPSSATTTPTTTASTSGNSNSNSSHSGVIAGTAAAPWTNVAYPASLSSGHLFTLSCPTADACWAVGASQTGAEILSTTNGGSTWVTETFPTSTGLQNNGHLFSVYCPTTSVCEAVGTAPTGSTLGATSQLIILATTDGGATWATQSYPSSLTNAHLFSVYCATATACWALGGLADGTPIILATTDGGATWATQTYPSGLNLAGNGFLSIACPNTQRCVISAAGNGVLEILSTADGGSTWTSDLYPSSIVATSNGIGSVSCPTVKACTITGFSDKSAPGSSPVIVATSDGGSTWHADSYPPSLGLTTLTGIWCPTAADCWALGNSASSAVIVATSNGGKSWHLQRYPLKLGPNDLASIGCPTASTCWVAGVGTTNSPVILVARKT